MMTNLIYHHNHYYVCRAGKECLFKPPLKPPYARSLFSYCMEDLKGSYVLIIRLDEPREITIGKLGKYFFKKGFYAYVGSARGTAGFKRVKRHFDIASGKNQTRKWHIDYLLPNTTVECAVLLPIEDDIECTVAKKIGEFSEQVLRFGCSDCKCDTHLFFKNYDWSNIIVEACKNLLNIEIVTIRVREV